MDQTVGDIEKLIYELYHNPGAHALANKYLTLAQVSRDAWDFSWSFLSPNKPVEVQYFGASSLHLKVSRCWHELETEESKTALRHRLLEVICVFMEEGSSRIVQTRLCVALAGYVVHTITDYWPTAISDLINNLKPERLPHIPPQKVIQILTEILMVIPEEFQSIHMTQNERSIARNALIKSIDQVFPSIDQILRQQPQENEGQQRFLLDIQQSAIKCFSNWSQHLGPLVLGDIHDPILELVLSCVANEDLASYASEAIISIYSHPEIHKYPNSVLRLIEKLVCLEIFLDKAVQENNMDLSTTLYNLFIQIGETHSRLLLDAVLEKQDQRESILKLISIILRCSATHGFYPVEETCSEQAFNFWYTFQDDIIASDQEKIPAYLAFFNPLYQSLIETLLLKVQFPEDGLYDGDWTSEDKEAFRCYRQDIGDTFMYCYNMLRVSMLSTLLAHFSLALNHLNDRANTSSRPWQHLEAVIFAFSAIAENVDVEEEVYLNQVFEALPRIPFAAVNQRLLSTAMEMLGSYCEWIYNHPALLPNVLSLLIMGLKGQQIAVVSCTMSLKDITRECQLLIQPFASQILSACEEGLREGSLLKPKERARLMCTVGQVLTTMPYDVTINYLNSLLPPILRRLQVSLNPEHSMDNHYPIRNDVVAQLSTLAMLFATLDPDLKQVDPEEMDVVKIKLRGNERQGSHPVLPIFKEVLPLLGNVGLKWISEETVIDALSECVKKAVVTLLDEVKPLVLDVLQLVVQLYVSSYHPTLLDILKQVLLLFVCDLELKPHIISCLSQMSSQTIAVCQEMRQRTNLIEYFYITTTLILKKQTDIFQSSLIDILSLFRLAVAALLLPERPTVKAVSGFLYEFINKSRESELMSKVVNEEGELLVAQAFTVIGGTFDSPRNVVEYMADILMALNQKYFDNLCRWMSFQNQKESFPTARVSREQKDNFIRMVLRERKNKRKLKEVVNEFALLSRGLIGTEYGLQSTLKLLPF